MTNELVAGPVNTSTPFTGLMAIESGESLCTAIQNGDWIAGGLSAFSLALDTVSTVIDPIGTAIAMGIGWLLEHMEPLKSWMNQLTGDAGQVAGFAQTWANIGTHLHETGAQLQHSLQNISALSGETVTAYRNLHSEAAEHVIAAGNWANGIGKGMEIASMIVQIVHDLARDAIATIVGSLSSAALTTILTAGFGAPAAIAQVSSKVSALAARVGKYVNKLVDAVTSLTRYLDELADLIRRVGDAFANAVQAGGLRPAYAGFGSGPRSSTFDVYTPRANGPNLDGVAASTRTDLPDVTPPRSNPMNVDAPRSTSVDADVPPPSRPNTPDTDVNAPRDVAPDAPASSGISPDHQAQIDNFQAKIDDIDKGVSDKPFLKRVYEGNIFNLENYHRYDTAEVHVTPRNSEIDPTSGLASASGHSGYPRIDSYDHGLEIVSRKHTQLAEIQPSTAEKYINELSNKYPAGRQDVVIADTPHNRAQFGDRADDIIGNPIKGEPVLEVPVQNSPPPVEALEHAASKGVTVRDNAGTTWQMSAKGDSIVEIAADGTATRHPIK